MTGNEQWPAYWRRLFDQHGFRMLDVIRPIIREERRVEWWYRQNIVMFASEEAMAANPALREASNDGKKARMDTYRHALPSACRCAQSPRPSDAGSKASRPQMASHKNYRQILI